MNINTGHIQSLYPCQDRFDNWKEKYPNFNGTLTQFLDLTEITYKDKVWVYFRSIPIDLIARVVADIAETVLHIFEEQYPNDNGPRKAIEAARAGNIYPIYASAVYASAVYDSLDTSVYSAYSIPTVYASAVYASAASASAAYTASTTAASVSATFYATNGENANEIVQIEIMKRYAKDL